MQRLKVFILMLLVLFATSITQSVSVSAQTAEERSSLTYEVCEASPDTTFPEEGTNAPTAGNDCFMLYQGQYEYAQVYKNDLDPLQKYTVCKATDIPKKYGKVIINGTLQIEVAVDVTEAFTFEYTLCNDDGSDTAEVTVIPLKAYPVKVKKLNNKMFRVTNPNTRDSGFVNFTWGDIDGNTCGQGNKTIKPGASKELKPYCKIMEWSASIGYGEAPAGKGTLKY